MSSVVRYICKELEAPPASTTELSIVVPTLNEAGNLPRLLSSVRRQAGVVIEVVVVDQSSTDDTAELAERFGCAVVSVPRGQYYSPPAASRNVGAKVATGPYLLHLDADMELPDPTFARRLLACFDGGHQAVVIHENDVGSGFWSRVKGMERACYRGTTVEAARAVTRGLFEEVGGYDEDISSGEDFWISDRYAERTSVASDDSLWVNHHTGRQTLSKLLRKKLSYGRSAAAYVEKSSGTERGSPLRYMSTCFKIYVRHWRRGRRHPLLYLAVFPLRVLEFAAIATGMAAERLRRHG